MWSDSGSDRVHRCWQVVRFAAYQNQIKGLAQSLAPAWSAREHRSDRAGCEFEVRFVGAAGAEGTDKKRDIAARFEQTSAEIAANGAGADNKDAHGR